MPRLGRFVWFELFTNDTATAPSFYEPVAQLRTDRWGESDYTMWVGSAGPIGGLMTLPEQARAMGAPPHWMGYLSVADVAATAERVTALGGRVLVPPTEIPNAGAYALFTDPQGAAFGVHGGGGDSPEHPPSLGEFGWAELATSDPEAAFGFYAELFGWVKTMAMDMGQGGTYQMVGRPGEPDIGAVMRMAPTAKGPGWVHYVRVADADAAFAKAKELGATSLYPPMDIPGGGRATLIADPQGAVIGMFSEPGVKAA